MNIPYSSIEPFGYTGIPTLKGDVRTFQQLTIIDWQLKAWWDRHTTPLAPIKSRRVLLECLRDMAKINGARVTHAITKGKVFVVYYKIDDNWGVTRLSK